MHGWSVSSVFDWSHAAKSETVVTDGPVRYLSVQGHWFEVLEQALGIYNLFCIPAQSSAYQTPGCRRWSVMCSQGPLESFHKVCFPESLPRTGVNSVCMVGMTALHWRMFALHLPSFSLVMMSSGGHSKNKEERGDDWGVGHTASPVCWKDLPRLLRQDTKTKISSALPCLRQLQGNVPRTFSS